MATPTTSLATLAGLATLLAASRPQNTKNKKKKKDPPAPEAALCYVGKNEFGARKTTVWATTAGFPDSAVQIELVYRGTIRKAYSAVVYAARCNEEDGLVAIKALNRSRSAMANELEILRMLDHDNIVKLRYFFYTGAEKDGLILHLVMQHMPKTMRDIVHYYKCVKGTQTPMLAVKLCMKQLFRALAHLHSMGVCHRDINPANIAIDPASGVAKLSGFGCAIRLVEGEARKPGVGSLHYRAPEQLYGASDYTQSVDIWSAGCVLAELLLGKPIFRGDSTLEQILEIGRVLGTLTPEVLKMVCPDCRLDGISSLPQLDPIPLENIFLSCKPPAAAIDLCKKLLNYAALCRLEPSAAYCHSFFDELKEDGKTLKDGTALPPLHN